MIGHTYRARGLRPADSLPVDTYGKSGVEGVTLREEMLLPEIARKLGAAAN
jgi:hypothetical protein